MLKLDVAPRKLDIALHARGQEILHVVRQCVSYAPRRQLKHTSLMDATQVKTSGRSIFQRKALPDKGPAVPQTWVQKALSHQHI